MDLRGRQNKDHIGGRFFQGFQQRVESSYGEHMNLVNNINLVFSLCRRIGNLIHNFPDIVHTVVGGRINLDYVHARPCANSPADSAFPAGAAVCRGFAVHCFCKNFGNGSLTRTSCAAKQIGMADTVRLYLIFQCGYNGILTFYLLKSSRSKFSVKGCV